MNSFRVSAIALLAASSFIGAVQASDLPARHHPVMPMMPPMFSWTGFYLGVNLGGAFSSVTSKHVYAANPSLTSLTGLNFYNTSKVKVPGTGFLGGLQLGYNYQWDAFVLGAEIDFDWTNLSAGRTFDYGDSYDKFKGKYFGTVRARIGYAADRALMYITGGYAYGNMRNKNVLYPYGYTTVPLANQLSVLSGGLPVNYPRAVAVQSRKNKVKNGWTIGGGLEYALTNNVLVGAEYLYMGFTKSKHNPFSPILMSMSTRSRDSQVRARVSYKF